MVESLRDNTFFQQLEDEHRKWLSGFEPYYLCKWDDSLNDNEEAAFAEAGVRRLLQSYGVILKPNDKAGGPDFCCFRERRKFYVEVTCILIETATDKTGISDEDSGEIKPFRPLNSAVSDKCNKKAKQCANLNAPVLLAIGTFHTGAGVLSFDDPFFVDQLLTGDVCMTFPVDVRTGKQVESDRWITEFNSAAFLRSNKTKGVDSTRRSISGLLLCNLGLKTPMVRGVLHPDTVRRFDPAILPLVRFRQAAIDELAGQLHVTWPGGDDG